MNWDKATDIMVYAAIATAGILAALAIYQWITRKSFKKIDRPLLALAVPAVLVVATWLLFDKIWILNTRPDGSGEPSFPSTHTMITATIFFCTAIILPSYIKNKSAEICLDLVMLAFVILVPIGRVLANKHWTSDVIGGLIFSVIYAGIYWFIVKKLLKPSDARRRKETDE